MTEFYLISGFLGSGKTTFLKQLISFFKDKKVALVINEFGKQGIDGLLLAELSHSMREVNNGSIFCACRLEQFVTTLQELTLNVPEIIIVEASGLSDPTIIKKVVKERDVFSEINYRGNICIIDSKTFPKVIKTALVCKKQLLCADIVLLNKTDLVNGKEKSEVISLIRSEKPNVTLFETSYGIIPADMEKVINVLNIDTESVSVNIIKDITLQKYLLKLTDNIDIDTLKNFLNSFINETYRIKGFVKIKNALNYVDSVQNSLKIEPFDGIVNDEAVQNIVILSGNGMKTAEAIKAACYKYPYIVLSIE
ncbi:MAG: hypothetical protein A2Y15_05265 [Clostridiales bacterium GWF2_36_10]|nr:MAG: hypothetical protein A2Y15_05265 [Clostridiales bacterium GWF2_36_10]